MNLNTLRRQSSFIFLSVLLVVSAGCSQQKGRGNEKDKITVSIPPIKYLIDKISGNDFEVKTMAAIGACQETYEPTPSQMMDVSKANYYFGIPDLEFEQKWLSKLSENNSGLTYVNVADGLSKIEFKEETDHHAEAEAHHHHGVDPHFWLSPKNYKRMANVVYRKLVAINPDRKNNYTKNYNRLVASIDSVDKTIADRFSKLRTRKFIIYHPALTYFANDYNLQQITIEKDGKEPDAAYMKSLVDEAARDSISTIFVQKEFDMSLIKSLSNEVGAAIVPVDTFAYDWFDSMNGISNAIFTSNK